MKYIEISSNRWRHTLTQNPKSERSDSQVLHLGAQGPQAVTLVPAGSSRLQVDHTEPPDIGAASQKAMYKALELTSSHRDFQNGSVVFSCIQLMLHLTHFDVPNESEWYTRLQKQTLRLSRKKTHLGQLPSWGILKSFAKRSPGSAHKSKFCKISHCTVNTLPHRPVRRAPPGFVATDGYCIDDGKCNGKCKGISTRYHPYPSISYTRQYTQAISSNTMDQYGSCMNAYECRMLLLYFLQGLLRNVLIRDTAAQDTDADGCWHMLAPLQRQQALILVQLLGQIATWHVRVACGTCHYPLDFLCNLNVNTR